MTFQQISSFLHLILQIASKIRAAGTKKKKNFLITQGDRGGKRNCIYLVLRTPSGAHALHFQIHCTEIFKTAVHF